jgi:hypothetical protein
MTNSIQDPFQVRGISDGGYFAGPETSNYEAEL